MAPAKPTKVAPKKRTRKRKRRAASSSSSSSGSDSSSSDDEPQPSVVKTITKTAEPDLQSDTESSDSSSDSDISAAPSISKETPAAPAPKTPLNIRRSPSPTPPPVEIPSFLPPKQGPDAEEKEREMKDKFRKFWMSSVADGFHDDLDQLRKEPNLGAGRLALLIDSLASGAEIFSSKADDGVTEMDIVLG